MKPSNLQKEEVNLFQKIYYDKLKNEMQILIPNKIS